MLLIPVPSINKGRGEVVPKAVLLCKRPVSSWGREAGAGIGKEWQEERVQTKPALLRKILM